MLNAHEPAYLHSGEMTLSNPSPEQIFISVMNWVLGSALLLAMAGIIVFAILYWRLKKKIFRTLAIVALVVTVLILVAWGISIYQINQLL